MAGRAAVAIDLGFLTENNVIDQPYRGLVLQRNPWDPGAGQIGLQVFGQSHEIQQREDVNPHESMQLVHGLDGVIEQMRDQLCLQVLQLVGKHLWISVAEC